MLTPGSLHPSSIHRVCCKLLLQQHTSQMLRSLSYATHIDIIPATSTAFANVHTQRIPPMTPNQNLFFGKCFFRSAISKKHIFTEVTLTIFLDSISKPFSRS